MTQIAPITPATPSAPPETAAASRDLQRQSLEQIVTLSIESTAREQQIEEQHTAALGRENADFQKKVTSTKQRHQRRMAELTSGAMQRQESIQARYDGDRQSLEAGLQKSQTLLTRKKEESDSAVKKQVEQSAWQAESALVATEMKVDADEQQWKKEEEKSQADLAALASLDTAAQQALTRYHMEVFPVETPIDDAVAKKIADDRLAVLAENRQQSSELLQQLQTTTQPRVMDDLVPLFLVLVFAGVAGVVGWFAAPAGDTKVLTAGGSAVGMFILGLIGFFIFRARTRAKVRAKAKTLFIPFKQSLAVAMQAARVDSEAAAAARERRVKEARRKRDQEVSAAREKGKAQLVQSAEQYRAATAAESQRNKEQLAAIEQEKDRGLAEAEQTRKTTTQQAEQEYAETRKAAQSQNAAALEAIESQYQQECHELEARWAGGLRTLTELMSVNSGIDPQLIDWNSPAWEQWKSPREFSGHVHFGEMKVDLAQLTEQVPKRLKLPETFSVPAMLALPSHGSLLIDTDQAGRSAAIDAAQMVMARLLTQLPAGRVKFTLFDPVGLGQSFAGFMHLADHDESLVGARIWTEKEHMQQRLADLTEHMETVIQKYLRNEYATIDEYNAQAGELAEPIRYLVIADFPIGFEAESLRRLSSIALSGPRCGVYTIVLRDTRQVLPPGSRMEDLIAGSVHLTYKNGAFTWDDKVFKRFPLRLDAAPDEKTLTRLMDVVGKAAKEAKRVEVPFQSIAPADGEFWSMSSKNELRVPIGKSGATRLQSLRLGVGVAQHALVAGKTGSGKSNLMHAIVTNMAMWYSPDEVEFYLIDFKKGVEFKAYVTSQLPHARAIAVESDREFGLSVLQRVDAELSRRGNMFRDAGVQEISAFRDRTGQRLPRTLLLVDEFQEFFTEDDKLSQEAAGLFDRLVRQGRAFGVHLVLGSQSIGGGSGLGRSTLGQIAVRVALQCTEADSQMILGDNNSAARLLVRPGEAIYNDAGGLVEANSPFQIAFLPDQQRERYLEHVRSFAQNKSTAAPTPIVFEGNHPAPIQKNAPLMALLQRPAFPPAASTVSAYLGEPVAIKEPTSIPFRRQSGAHVLMVGQQEQSAVAIFASMIASLAAQHAPGDAIFYLLDGSPADSRFAGTLERVLAAIPHSSKTVPWKQVPESINEIATLLKDRQGNDAQPGPAVYLFLFGLQRFRLLRRAEDDFSFSRGEEPAAPKPDKQFADLLAEGPAHGIHTILWADTPIAVERTLERSAMRQFDHRILFQMSASDSSNLIDSPLANRLGAHRALLYSEEQGTFEKFRPYETPDDAWLEFLTARLKNRPA